ncbi:MAG: metallophosphoesterase family protein [Myxococcota bacterium]
MPRKHGRQPPFREDSRTLDVSDAAAYRLAVVADTHGRPHPATRDLVEAERPAAILHAGDVGDLAVLDDLEAVAPVIAVRGNIDDRGTGLPDGVSITLEDRDGPLLGLYLTHIAVQRGRLMRGARRRARKAGAQLVICGHSHVPLQMRDEGLAVFNPGSCGPRRFHLPIVFGVLDLDPGGVRLRHVSCETGEAWRP